MARLDFPLLRNAREWELEPPPQSIHQAQGVITWAEHLLIVFPLWAGDMHRAPSLKSLKRNILEFCGISPVRTTMIGMIEGSGAAREDWLTKLSVLGVQGA